MNPINIQIVLRRLVARTIRNHAFRLRFLTAIGLVAFAVNETFAQVSTINSAVIQTNLIGGLPNAQLTVVDSYPSVISFSYTNAGSTNTGFSAEQDVWMFSISGSTNAYLFQSNDYYTATMDVMLTGEPVSPRKEAGFAFEDINSAINGQYILDTDAGEVVAFGGNLPFYASPLDHTFKSGDTITMGVTILKDSDGNNAIIYSANGIESPILEFNQNAVYLANGTTPEPYTLGGYLQVQGQGTGPTNSGSAVFQNIAVGTPLGVASGGANQTVVYWPVTSTNFVLQMATNITATNWTAVNGLPIQGVIIPATTPNTFFRLEAQ